MNDISVPKRNLSVDLVKIIAMIGVMSLHTNLGRLDNPISFALSRFSGISVPLFFMVSGYLLFDKNSDWKYSAHKIFAIIKFVIIISLGYSLLVSLYRCEIRPGYVVGQLISPFIQRGPFGVFWYLGAMCIIYVLFPIITYFDRKDKTFLIKSLIGLIVLEFFVFIINMNHHFEFGIIQTFRVWNWILYFILGIIVKKYKLAGVDLKYPIAASIIFVAFVAYSRPYIGGVEYFFSSPICILYAFVVFVYVVNLKIHENKLIAGLSKLFLPVYAIHMFVIKYLKGLLGGDWCGIVTPLVDLIIVSMVTICISYILSKIPYVKGIFKL